MGACPVFEELISKKNFKVDKKQNYRFQRAVDGNIFWCWLQIFIDSTLDNNIELS